MNAVWPWSKALAVAALSVLTFAPTTARAWTEAEVRTVKAHVEIEPDGVATVSMSLLVRVRRGWLDGLEIAGLDPDLRLDTRKPLSVVSRDGMHKFRPTVLTRSDGRVSLSFDRHRSPRKGVYLVRFQYRANLVSNGNLWMEDKGTVHMRWSFPGWKAGLDTVVVTMTAPFGTEEVSRGDSERRIEPRRYLAGARTMLRWERAHLPRTLAWPFELNMPDTEVIDWPEEAAARQLGSNTTSAAADRERRQKRDTSDNNHDRSPISPFVAAALIAGIALIKQLLFWVACTQRKAQARPVLPLPSNLLRSVAIIAAGTGAGFLWMELPLESLALLLCVVGLSLQRTAKTAQTRRQGRWVAAPRSLRSQHRWLECSLEMFSFWSPAGWSLLLGFLWLVQETMHHDGGPSYAATVSPLEALILLAPVMATGTNHQLPSSNAQKLRRVLAVAERLCVPITSLTPKFCLLPVVHRTSEGDILETRLQIHLVSAVSGLIRCDVAYGDRTGPGGYIRRSVLVLTTLKNSEADFAIENLVTCGKFNTTQATA
ncbi:MAG: hypothetical protein AAF550_04700, partial [Myxococcota bacterium]